MTYKTNGLPRDATASGEHSICLARDATAQGGFSLETLPGAVDYVSDEKLCNREARMSEYEKRKVARDDGYIDTYDSLETLVGIAIVAFWLFVLYEVMI